jgi:hypothetical protein
MLGMKKGPIGVWFSVALVILVSSAWVGSKAGSKIAQYWDSRQRQKQGTLSVPEWAHVESTLSELSAIQTLQLYAVTTHNNKSLAKKYLFKEIGGLENLKRRSRAVEIGPVIDMYLGLAYVDSAMAEEQDNNKEVANKYMNRAQTLFRSLGWRDYSAKTLRIVARRELDRWNGEPQTRQDGK